MKITICGSMQFEPKMSELADQLVKRGYEVDRPNVVEGHVYEDSLDVNAILKRGFIDEHFAKIDTSEAILVVNEPKKGIDGYIGGNTLIEIAYAYSQGLDIFLLNPVPEMDYCDEINGMHPMVLGGDLDVLDNYVSSLPLAYMSTESALKQRAAGRAMRRAGVAVRVDGKKVDSGVAEQPMTINETYQGAMNRQANLLKLGVEADYYVTVESGQHPVHENHSLYGCTVVVVEPSGQDAQVAVDLDVEFPREWIDKVPAVYPDFGELVKQKFGMHEKDPNSVITDGKISRLNVVELVVYKAMVQLKAKEK